MKLRIPQGRLAIISAYAPFGYPFDERQRFFEDLGTMCRKTSVNQLKYVSGDLNSHIHRQMPGEETVIGEHAFGDPSAELGLGSNRELLLEFCVARDLAIANACYPNPVECANSAMIEVTTWTYMAF